MKTLEQSAVEARVVRMLRGLASPIRFRIAVELAERKECSAAALAAMLPLSASSLFEHLTVLRGCGVVQSTGAGPARLFCLDPTALDFLAGFLSGTAQRARSWAGLVEAPGWAEGSMGLTVRDATAADAAAIATIYNQGIEDRVATLETVLRTSEERAEWLATRGPRHPVLVAEDRNIAVVGWASLNSFNPRPAYDHVADLSVYVAREQRGRGIGDLLLSALEGRARANGFHKMVLAAFPTNAPGMRLYERHGFLTVGIYHEQGLLDGRWVDVIVMEKILG